MKRVRKNVKRVSCAFCARVKRNALYLVADPYCNNIVHSLGSRPSPFHACFNYAHAANIQSYKCSLGNDSSCEGRTGVGQCLAHTLHTLWSRCHAGVARNFLDTCTRLF